MALDEVLNAGRLETALVLFSDEAVATFLGLPEPNRFAGKEQIRSWLQSDISEEPVAVPIDGFVETMARYSFRTEVATNEETIER